MLKFLKSQADILAISTLGFLIRLTGTKWGFPSTLHSDESVLVRSSLGMRFGELNPHHFDWPSLYFYLNYFIYWVFLKVRVRLQVLFGTEQMELTFPFWWHHELPFYYISRILATTFSAGTILLVYWATKILFKSKKIALISGLIYSFGYLSIYFSRYGIHDSAYTFFVFLSFIFSLKILNKNSTYKSYLLAGLFAGIATSIKYSGAIACIFILLASIYKNKSFVKGIFSKYLFLAAFVSVVVFLIGTPYALLDYDTFSSTEDYRGAFWQISHMGRGLNWGYHITGSIVRNYGILGAILSYIGLFLLGKGKNKKQIFFVTGFLLTLLYIGSWGITRDHYSLPLLPFLAITAAFAIVYIQEKYKSVKSLEYILLAAILIQPVISTSVDTYKRLNGDTRNVSGNWIEQNIEKGENIFLSGGKTGVYGGDNPVFDWGNYSVTNIVEMKEGDLGYVIYAGESSLEHINRENCRYFDNKSLTGPNISICKIL